ncbi:MAG: transposase [Gammaproteobacteria bacterium]|nr:transposase [Gammaproteobacteria bacterium]MDH3408916.1 transposase [Gammaproteobacteria bacterium]MDH3552821.1 transposase [Gammaproteobacteria bacterium]
MPRTARASKGGICYHVINRGNARCTVYHNSCDYDSFTRLMIKACSRMPMRILAYCLMPNHFHLVLWPYGDGDMSRWMHWLLTSHVRRYHRLHGTSGRIWQGRFKAFPIQQDRHLLTVMRYVERNPVRANLVESAIDWHWSSLVHQDNAMSRTLLSETPVTKPPGWNRFVDRPQTNEELEALRRCSFKCAPFGSDHWVRDTAVRLGLKSSLRGPGRPKRGHS